VDFRSDNVTGVCPEVLAAIVAANDGSAAAYGEDAWTERAERALADLFETPVAVFPVATGTAANALSLAALTPVYGAVYAHEAAHITVDECNAPEFYTGGAKIVPLPGDHGKVAAAHLARVLAGAAPHGVDEVAAIAGVCRDHGVALHMDGARIANAVVHLGCSFADLTWRAGVDVLSFGATKNGAMAAEAVVFFDLARAERMPFLRKRAGHLLSKMRFVSAQLEAYARDDVWRRNAVHANAAAARLVEGVRSLPGVELVHPLHANEIFIRLPAKAIEGLAADGFRFHPWGDPATHAVRLVTGFSTTTADVDRFVRRAKALCG
jgi:threonine aldolase